MDKVDSHPWVANILQVGDSFSGSFSFDTAVADKYPDDTTRGVYYSPGMFAVSFGNYHATQHADAYIHYDIWDGSFTPYNTSGDLLGIESYPYGQWTDNTPAQLEGVYRVYVSLRDLTGQALPDDSLPEQDLNLASFDKGSFVLTFNPGYSLTISGELESLTKISQNRDLPEPGTLVLVVLGLAGVGHQWRARQSPARSIECR